MKHLGLHLPLNSLSFGNVSFLLLRKLFEYKNEGKFDGEIYLFPRGPIDASTQIGPTPEFNQWINEIILNGLTKWKREYPMFCLWHLSGLLESHSNNPSAMSFYELDAPTKFEVCAAKNNKMCFTSKFTCDTFKTYGIESKHIPLAFDSFNFKPTNKKYHTDSRVVFNILGKLELRKQQSKVIQSWIKRFGNNNKFVLQCGIYNQFLQTNSPQGVVDLNNQYVAQIFGNNKPYNVTLYPFMKDNAQYNDLLCSANIVIGMSAGEGWGWPEFTSLALGRHGILLDAHAYSDWANDSNAVMVKPNGKMPIVDQIFFKQGDMWNQGQGFSWDEDTFIAACEQAIKRVEANPLNENGLLLQERFSANKFVDNILKLTLE